MARQTMTLACTASAFIDSNSPDTNKHGAGSYNLYDYLNPKWVLFGFDAFPANLGKKIIYSWSFAFSAKASQTDLSFMATAYAPYFDETAVTFNNWPTGGGVGIRLGSYDPLGTSIQRFSGDFSNASLAKYRQIAISGVFYSAKYGTTADVYTRAAAAANRPVITIEYDDTTDATSKVYVSGKTSGYLDPEIAQTFSWGLVGDPYSSMDAFVQTAATFSWSSDGGSTWNDIQISGNTKSATVDANTFPRGTILWKVTATDDRGATTTSSTYTISTEDQLITSTPVSPSGTLVSGSEEITFSWTISSPSGTVPLASRFLYKLDGASSWTTVNISGPATSYTMPAGTLTAGNYAWGVNVQNQAGNWSSGNPTAQFLCVAAPPAPVVDADGVPFATVNWQAEGQQAYRITVDGTVYGPYFGTTKTWPAPDYLPDGEHTITVEVQGVYGLWSQPGSASFAVQNQPGDAVTLSGKFERDGVLSWVTTSQTADFLIFRDGVQIGHTSAQAFVDRFALGEHSYRVVNRLPDGNYTASNIVTGTMLSCTAAIAPLTGGSWIELMLSENSNREESFTWTQAVSMRHFAGAEYPMAEQSPFADLSGSYDVSFADLPSAKAFEALRGQAVILKSRGGNVMIGILSTLSKRMTEFYIAFVFSLQRMHWRDYIDADDQL